MGKPNHRVSKSLGSHGRPYERARACSGLLRKQRSRARQSSIVSSFPRHQQPFSSKGRRSTRGNGPRYIILLSTNKHLKRDPAPFQSATGKFYNPLSIQSPIGPRNNAGPRKDVGLTLPKSNASQ